MISCSRMRDYVAQAWQLARYPGRGEAAAALQAGMCGASFFVGASVNANRMQDGWADSVGSKNQNRMLLPRVPSAHQQRCRVDQAASRRP